MLVRHLGKPQRSEGCEFESHPGPNSVVSQISQNISILERQGETKWETHVTGDNQIHFS